MPVSLFKNVVLLLLLFSGISTSAQRHTNYYIIFSARDASLRPFSIGGHAIVSWGYMDKPPVIRSEKSMGFFPGEGETMVEAIVSTKRGRVVKGYFKNSKGLYMQQLTIEVDSVVWADTQHEADIWNYQPYNLFTKNCLHFMDRVAQMAALKRPRTYTFLFHFPLRPVKYTKRLYRKNKKRAILFKEIQFDIPARSH